MICQLSGIGKNQEPDGDTSSHRQRVAIGSLGLMRWKAGAYGHQAFVCLIDPVERELRCQMNPCLPYPRLLGDWPTAERSTMLCGNWYRNLVWLATDGSYKRDELLGT